MRFVNFKQTKGQPPTPSALVADISSESVFGVAYYRDDSLALRTPTKDSSLYKMCNCLCRELLETDKMRWTNIRLAQPLFEDFKLKWGLKSYILSKPSDSIYPASSALDIPQYVEHGTHLLDTDYDVSEENFVQYAPRNEKERAEDDFESFFGGNLYRDRKVGSNIVTYRITPSSSSSLMSSLMSSLVMDETEQITSKKGHGNIIETRKNDDDETRCKRRKSL
mmetsp:Transcript_36446/g.63883  ORF Transcript_36446/g.63883 Transcript_36446/m.63883 type:complete len:223 (+) Transcript_36446:105-773(+)